MLCHPLPTAPIESHASHTRDHTHIGVIRMRDVMLCVQRKERAGGFTV